MVDKGGIKCTSLASIHFRSARDMLLSESNAKKSNVPSKPTLNYVMDHIQYSFIALKLAFSNIPCHSNNSFQIAQSADRAPRLGNRRRLSSILLLAYQRLIALLIHSWCKQNRAPFPSFSPQCKAHLSPKLYPRFPLPMSKAFA